MSNEVEVFKRDPRPGRHMGSRSSGRGWYARLPDGTFLREVQTTAWPPYPVRPVMEVEARPVKTKREALSMVERYEEGHIG